MIHFIINPLSSTGKGAEKWKIIEEILKKNGTEYSAHLTTGYLDARNHAAGLVKSGEHVTIIAVGGDGTVNEVLSGIDDFSKVTFGYIPSGSSNDLARDIGLSKDPEEALSSILHPKEYREIDVGRLESGNEVRNFSVSMGMGFDAAICHEALHSKLKYSLNRIGLGKLTYGIIALKQLYGMKPCDCTLLLDGTKKVELKELIFVTVMNHRYEGGGFMFCPDAKDNDGYLDICVASSIKKLKVLFILPFAFSGKHVRFKGVDVYRAKKVEILAKRPCAVHSDGESAGVEAKVKVYLNNSKLKMIVR
ncbi:MAG: diacylglycerol kinase family lipid kinase [Lachnospiraceae bacterium]|nr:diacylglycerol kinase family lipid kinase [Lachnospiraceae bacterium]